MERKRAARVSGVPLLTVPNILVVNDSQFEGDDEGMGRSFKAGERPAARWTHLSVGEGGSGHQGRKSTDTGSTRHGGSHQHPLSLPRLSLSTGAHQCATSGFSFELYESESQGQGLRQSSQRRGSTVGPTQARDLLDDSVWMESIRRSATMRRLERGSSRYSNLG